MAFLRESSISILRLNQCFIFITKQEHFNYFAQDENLGPLILSVKHETIGGEDALRVVLRSKAGTIHDVLAVSTLGDSPIPARIAKVCDMTL